ncbi:hypothetical protein [Deinococcus frigens]|uniref:hypothetical protein n=1 Tax=Deinococcus frigens TaxID=249403 RepID=UPI0012EC534C|nr:hypothetical protein [Deinococcus frigens]
MIDGTNSNFISFGNANTFKVTCPSGHQYIYLIQNQQFEILFEFSLYAFSDGYWREAVMSAATALESFMGYYCRLFMVDSGVDFDELELAWRNIKLSERRTGLFLGLYLIEHKQSAPSLKPKITSRINAIELRNSAVHEGRIPSEGEARKYLEFVYNYIVNIEINLRSRYEDAMIYLWHQQLDNTQLRSNRALPEEERMLVLTGSERTALEYIHIHGVCAPEPFDSILKNSLENRYNIQRLRSLNTHPLDVEGSII